MTASHKVVGPYLQKNGFLNLYEQFWLRSLMLNMPNNYKPQFPLFLLWDEKAWGLKNSTSGWLILILKFVCVLQMFSLYTFVTYSKNITINITS